MTATGIVGKALAVLTALMMLTGTNLKGGMEEIFGVSAKPSEEASQGETAETISEAVDPVALCDEITVGWCLGNSLDATGSGLNSETSWSNPVVTKELILAVKDAGFDAVRIPTTWYNHVDEDFNIDEKWMDRVQQVVDYAYGEGMYVILNAHHENWNDPYKSTLSTVKAKIQKLWTQIAERFKGYGERLIFEGMNEPRWKNTDYEWNGGNSEGRSVVNEYNECFVEAVRATGGNNSYRALMIPTYAASSSALDGFTVPDDESIIVSIHAYSPYNFAMNASGTTSFDNESSSDTRELQWLSDTLYDKFISKGVGAIIGECGTINKNNLEDRINWAEYFPKVFGENGIPVFLWDNNAFTEGSESFGQIHRDTLKWEYPSYIKAFVKAAKKAS